MLALLIVTLVLLGFAGIIDLLAGIGSEDDGEKMLAVANGIPVLVAIVTVALTIGLR